MPTIRVEQLTPGQVLSGPVVDRRGRLLLPAGKSLTEKHLDALRMWGIAQVEIEGVGPDEDAPSSVDPELLGRARAELMPFFARADLEHPFVAMLFEYCTIRRARHALDRAEAGEHVA